jgi:hypothetical protein
MSEDEKHRFILIVSAIVAALAVHRLAPSLSVHALEIRLPHLGLILPDGNLGMD